MSAVSSLPSSLSPQVQADIQNDFMAKWEVLLRSAATSSLAAPRSRRFKNEAWSSSPTALVSAHAWELFNETLQAMVRRSELSPDVKEKLSFMAMQWAEAACPANFLATNPETQRKLVETQGSSMLEGVKNLWSDAKKGRLTQSDESQFEVGRNLAATPGSVVFRNALFELIHYKPTTENVKSIPLLIVPPCINKFYILDLQERSSFVKHALDNEFQVFLISWRNPMPHDDDMTQQATWGDYLEHGVLQAIEATQRISQQERIHCLGFCVGGTLLSSALALAEARGESPCHTLTLLTTMLDFHDVGPLKVFVDEALALIREWQMGTGGLLPAADLLSTFAFLRPSELVWNYVTDNYLKGEMPAAFDLLYWNADGTNLPGPFFTWYFRNAYLENKLKDKGGVTINGHPLDFRQLSMPAYVYGSIDDHIVPWRSSYRSAQLFGAEVQFVLGASGHIAGVINPPINKRRHYWAAETNTSVRSAEDPDQWLEQAQKHEGSWWPNWLAWLAGHSVEMKKAPKVLGSSAYPEITAAPGEYVRVRAI